MIDSAPLSRIDSFAYRHRLADVMASPAVTGNAAMTLQQACKRMYAEGVSSLVVTDGQGRCAGILTERDLLGLVSRKGVAALDLPLGEIMSFPVHSVPADAFLFVALGRMTRLGLRHLVVVDDENRPLGMVTGRALLKIRSSEALAIGDSIQEADRVEELAQARATLPRVARGLLAEGVSARNVAAVISGVVRDLTARAAQLSERSMTEDGWGPAPARWALLVLGSGGRGESLLAFDQDNAIVHQGNERDDLWFAEMGRRVADMLDAAGLPYCNGGVMARNREWRRSLDEWQREIRSWVFAPSEQKVLNIDIFFDFQPVHGDRQLAEELRGLALDTARQSEFFLQFLAFNASRQDNALGLFGQFATKRGRLNAKKFGLLPLVSAARAKAVRSAITATGTAERFGMLAAQGKLQQDDLRDLTDILDLMMRLILEQQLLDLENGQRPSALIEPRRLPRDTRRRLKESFRRLRMLKSLLGGMALMQ
ncbi:DUF294 nucleotidyltransferase-like domain-containing protein [Telmatospirillum sp. J64-1]|uniref:DUF294 nucleotidyltransferase-like domain-containing protein n=1 Tax=Telmatospirillum sp. J64-1 TaxID=2502183 RepID=UPI00115CEDFE|nr:DUF294 nucleotidyltransferase-like domain-containing protein [Telmatospirillum sp. J64-1]